MFRGNRRWQARLRGRLLLAVPLAAALVAPLRSADGGGLTAALPLHVRIDELVRQTQPGTSARRCSDAEFVRRLSIDLLGSIPTADEARAFVADQTSDKRTRLVSRLLDHPRHAVQMTHVFDVMLLERRNTDTVKQEDWERYLFDSFCTNKPYDRLAQEILTADGTDPKLRPAVKFYLERNGDPNLLTREVGRLFFGKDLQCCQCHDHPSIDHFHQADYYGLFAFLQRGFVTIDKTLPENKDKPAYFGERAEGLAATFQSVFDPRKTKHATRPRLPGEIEIDEPYYPVGADYKTPAAGAPYAPPKYSRRDRLAKEVIATGNLAFRRAIVNRLWAHMMGQGLFEPVDLDHPDNPPINPRLLDELADAFPAMHYDVNAFLRELALTQAYQRSVQLPPSLAEDARQAALDHSRLDAEQKRLASRTAELDEAVKHAEERLAPLHKAAEAPAEELAKSEAKAAEAKKAADAAATAMTQTRADVDAKRAVAVLLLAAAAKTREAAAKLPNEKDLASAADKFKARADTFVAAAAKLSSATQKQAENVRKTADALVAAQRECCRIAARVAAARAATVPAARNLREARVREEAHITQLNAVKQAAAVARSLEEYAAHEAAAHDAATKVQAARSRRTVAQSVAQIRSSLAGARRHQLAATALLSPDDGSANAIMKEALAVSAAELDAASREVATAEFECRKLETRELAERTAAENELSGLAAQWSRRFAAATLKPIPPEQLAWNVMQALGIVLANRAAVEADLLKKEPKRPAPSDAAGMARWSRRIEWETYLKLKGPIQRFVTLFGAESGQPQGAFFVTVDQSLFFANGGELASWLAPSGENLTARLLKAANNRQLADELYFSVLTRPPSGDEATEIDQYLALRSKDRSAAVQEAVWALLTSSEFRFNH